MKKQLRIYGFRSLLMGMVLFLVSFIQMFNYKDNRPMLENWAVVTLFAELVVLFSVISLIINKNK
jgi:hypothetical protein